MQISWRAFMNNGGGQASVATGEMNGYGPIALYAGKDCEVRFKNVAYKDLAIKRDPRGASRQRLSHAAPEPLLLRLVGGSRRLQP